MAELSLHGFLGTSCSRGGCCDSSLVASVSRRRRVINTCRWESGLGVSGLAKCCLIHALPMCRLVHAQSRRRSLCRGLVSSVECFRVVGLWCWGKLVGAGRSLLLQHLLCGPSNLVDPASSHMLVSKIKPCMSQCKFLYGRTVNGSLKQL